jgi:TatD DNase family protein
LANAAEKPLIVHCVKAWQDLIQLHKQLRPVTPWIYHGFRGNFSAMQALLSQGILLSFGEALLQSTRLQLVIAQMPRGCFLLETDTGNTTIEAIYNSAARARQVSTETLQEQIWETAIKVFPGIVRG